MIEFLEALLHVSAYAAAIVSLIGLASLAIYMIWIFPWRKP